MWRNALKVIETEKLLSFFHLNAPSGAFDFEIIKSVSLLPGKLLLLLNELSDKGLLVKTYQPDQNAWFYDVSGYGLKCLQSLHQEAGLGGFTRVGGRELNPSLCSENYTS